MTDFFSIPSFCPSCGHNTEEVGSFLFCKNKSCSAKASGSIKIWVEKLGLLNWGDALIDSLSTKINSIADLYRLSVEDLALHCSGMKHAKKCHDILHLNKDIKLELVLSAISIQNLGISTATDIVNSGFDTVEKITQIKLDDLVKIPNIGEKTATSVFDGIQEKTDLLRELNKVISITGVVSGSLTGKSFCITGNTKVPRKALQKKILDNGGVVKETVVSGLSYLITNEDLSVFISDKVKKAKKYNTDIISESDFLRLIDG